MTDGIFNACNFQQRKLFSHLYIYILELWLDFNGFCPSSGSPSPLRFLQCVTHQYDHTWAGTGTHSLIWFKIPCPLSDIGMRKQLGKRNLALSSFYKRVIFFKLHLHRWLSLTRIFCSSLDLFVLFYELAACDPSVSS